MEKIVDKYYPVQGSNKFQTASFPITKAFAVDFGAMTTGVATLISVPKGSLVLGFVVKVTEALETASAGTVTFGFTGTPLLSTAHASATATLGTMIVPPDSSGMAMALTADDTFDLTLVTNVASAGKADCYVTYIPMPVGDLSTSDFLSIVTT